MRLWSPSAISTSSPTLPPSTIFYMRFWHDRTMSFIHLLYSPLLSCRKKPHSLPSSLHRPRLWFLSLTFHVPLPWVRRPAFTRRYLLRPVFSSIYNYTWLFMYSRHIFLFSFENPFPIITTMQRREKLWYDGNPVPPYSSKTREYRDA